MHHYRVIPIGALDSKFDYINKCGKLYCDSGYRYFAILHTSKVSVIVYCNFIERWIFKDDKVRSTVSFGGEIKTPAQCRKILHVKDPYGA
jgi:hypothetical protein